MWEKRYQVLKPRRINRNIRVYDVDDLRKLLNIRQLQQSGQKISHLSQLSENEINEQVKSQSLEKWNSDFFIDQLVLSMFSLDEALFEEVYKAELRNKSFSDIFETTYLPLLNLIGELWQSNAISPVHEHFISNLIYQKLMLNIALVPVSNMNSEEVYILCCPKGEIHDVGLLYLHYKLKSRGTRCVYLGSDIPMVDINSIISQFSKVTLVCYFLLARTEEEDMEFYLEMKELMKRDEDACWIINKNWNVGSMDQPDDRIKNFH